MSLERPVASLSGTMLEIGRVCLVTLVLTSASRLTAAYQDPVDMAARIAGPAAVTVAGELGRPLTLYCPAYGYPPPGIYWYHGTHGPMVEIHGAKYEARDQLLLIRQLTQDTLGDYMCNAYNGVNSEKPATWLATVVTYEPEETGAMEQTPPPLIASPPLHYEAVVTSLVPAGSRFSTGSEVSLPCEARGYPPPSLSWTKDGVPIAPTDNIRITESRVTILRAQPSDSGVYTCRAANAYSAHESFVQISVQDVYVPANCVDNPMFAKCSLIVQNGFCSHEYYSKFCCKSCVEAGQLDPQKAGFQGDEPFRRK